MGETHICDENIDHLDIPGFSRLKYKNRKKGKNNTTPGGISVFVRQNVAEYFQLVETHNEDIIWLKIIKEKTNMPDDVYLGTTYLNPHRGEIAESVNINKIGR